MKDRLLRAVLRVVVPYAVFAGLWIYASDTVLERLGLDPATTTALSIYKGLAFVVVTAALLSALLSIEIRSRHFVEDELRRVNRALRAISDCNQAVMRAGDEVDLLNRVCSIVVGVGGYRLAWVGMIEDDEARTVRPVAQAGLDDGYLTSVDIALADPQRSRGPAGTALVTGAPALSRNIPSDPLFAPWRAEATARGYASVVALPLLADGETLGVLVIYSARPDAFDARELELLEELTADLAFGITTLRRRRDQLRAEEALRHQDQLLRETGRLAQIGGWEFDPATGRGTWTEEVARIHGLDPSDPTTVARGMSFYHGESRRQIEAAIRAAVEHGTPYDLELELVDAAGAHKWVHTIGHPTVVDGRTVHVRGSFQDITARRQAEAEIRRLNEELEQRVRARTAELEAANRELEAFSYSVSHDLRAPLRTVDGFCRVLLEDHAPRLDAEGQRVCRVISEGASDMGRLVDDLLAFSRVGRAALRRSPVDMAGLARSIFFEVTTPELRGRIDLRLGALPGANADPTLMRQVWANLLSNAVKFSGKRERALIEVEGRVEDGELVYAVRDNGAGFDMRYADKLFGVFQRLHSAREFEGTGVGLAIVQRIVHRHGGRIWAEGETDRGAAFHFTLAKGE